MRKRTLLPERSDCFFFDHKPSEINYGGKMRFQQVAFLPRDEKEADIETLIFRVVNRFAEIIQERSAKTKLEFAEWQSSREDIFIDEEGGDLLVFKAWHAELADIFYDQWCETPLLRLKQFQTWIDQDVMALVKAYRRLRINAMLQEHATGIYRLNYFLVLAISTIIAEVISEYFEKQLEQLGKMATMARYNLGRTLSLVFLAVEESEALNRVRTKELGTPEVDDGVRRLLNPFVLGFIDIADVGMIEEVIAGPNPYQASHHLRTGLLALFTHVINKSSKYQTLSVKHSLANPETLRELMESRKERNRLLTGLRRNRELRTRIVFENTRQIVRHALREYLRVNPQAADIWAYVSNEHQMDEILTKPAMQRKFLRMLRGQHTAAEATLARTIQEGIRQIKRSRRGLFARLSKRELLDEFEIVLRRFSGVLAHTDDFKLLRAKYGRDSNHAINWQGIRIWRIQDLTVNHHAKSNQRILLMNILDKRLAEIENHFTEGNLFIGRSTGEIYPQQQQRRGKVVFLFADLRNSTETTMKLTKDTASFLTPYLTAVNTSALLYQGKRIYFAGDGYAAYYEKAADAIRAAHTITGQFTKLRKISSEEHLREAKEIYQAAMGLGIDLKHPNKIKQSLNTLEPGKISKKVSEFLVELSQVEEETVSEDLLKKILSRVAAAHAMPRVDVGVALTNGELFFALVGDDKNDKAEKIPIVISPQLTQAARLSGSSDLVKNYIDTHLPQPFQFNAYSWDKKLYNRGIVITEELYEQIQQEMDIKPLQVTEPEWHAEKLTYYSDQKLQRNIILRENEEPVLLKGIAKPCRVYEVITMGSALEKKYGALE